MVKQKETKWKPPMLPLEWEVEREDDWEDGQGREAEQLKKEKSCCSLPF